MKDQAAVALGRKGGRAYADNHSATELSAAGANAVNARWAKYYREHPDKLQAKLDRAKRARSGRPLGSVASPRKTPRLRTQPSGTAGKRTTAKV